MRQRQQVPRVTMKTVPCRGCGEPTRAYCADDDALVECEDCSGVKQMLMCDAGTRRLGFDPASVDLRYDGRVRDRPERRPPSPRPETPAPDGAASAPTSRDHGPTPLRRR